MKPSPLTFLFLGICLTLSVHCYTDLDFPTDMSSIDNNTLHCWAFFISFVTSLPWGPNITQEIKYFQLYSGHNINDLGEYTLCQNQPTQKYTVIEFVSGVGKLGFCGPAFCDVNKMKRFSELLNKAVANLTAITKLPPDFEILNVVDPDAEKVEKGSWFYFAIGVLAIFSALVVIGTATKNIHSFKKILEAKREPKTISTLNGSLTDIILAPEFTEEVIHSHQSLEDHFQNDYSESRKYRKKSKPSMFGKIIGCFDISKNLSELLTTQDNNPKHDQNLKALNGIRALIFSWVVYGHVLLSSITAKNIGYISHLLKSAKLLILIAAFYAVDTFFFLSGFFIGYILIEKLKSMRPGIKSYLSILLHRWLRLWPAYMVVLIFVWKISPHIGSGPLWYNYLGFTELCDSEAWKNVLLMDNVLSKDFTACMPWAWYISCEFQIFLLTPFICWIYLKKRSRGLYIIWALIGISLIAAYAYTEDSHYTFILMPSKSNDTMGLDYMSKYYVNPLARMSPYLLGVWLGILFREFKNGKNNFLIHIQSSKIKSFACLILGFALMIFIVFFPRTLQTGHTWSDGFAMSWGILMRPLWVIGVFLFITPCLVGNFKPLADFMGNRYFTLIAKLSYTGYLVHYMVILLVLYNVNKLYGISQGYQTMLSLSILIVSCVCATVLHLLVEKPIINIERVILNKNKDTRIEDRQLIQKEI